MSGSADEESDPGELCEVFLLVEAVGEARYSGSLPEASRWPREWAPERRHVAPSATVSRCDLCVMVTRSSPRRLANGSASPGDRAA